MTASPELKKTVPRFQAVRGGRVDRVDSDAVREHPEVIVYCPECTPKSSDVSGCDVAAYPPIVAVCARKQRALFEPTEEGT